MKLFKFNNTNLFVKILCILLLCVTSGTTLFAQEGTGPTTAPAAPTTAPTTQPITPTDNRTKTQEGRVPAATVGDARDVALTPAEQAAIEREEAARLRREAEIQADEEKATIIKRTFGSSFFANNKFDLAQAINVPTPNNYVLGPGDKMSINIFGYSQHTQTVTVSADGDILLEKGGIVNVSGLSITDAEAKIKQTLTRIYPGLRGNPANTYLKVSLTGFKAIKIKVTGNVIAPGTYTATSFSSLMTALYVSGGPNEIGTYRDIKLVRGNKVIATFDMYEYIVNGFSKSDILLKDQDVIHVGPYVSRVAVQGFTKIQGLFEMLPNEKISDLIRYAGGFNQYAFSELIKVYRNTASERKIINVAKADFATEPVFTGDSVVVEKVLERLENVVTIEGAVYRPGEYSLDSNPTLLSLIKSASGLKDESLNGRINITRTNKDLSVSNISINLADIESGHQSDFALKRLDKIFVPSIFDLTETSYIKIRGAINNPDAQAGVTIPYVKNMTIQDVLVKVGGLTEAASLSRVEIVRRKRNVDPTQLDAQISDILYFDIRPDYSLVSSTESGVLLPYDEIIVRTSPNYEKQIFVKITGEVIYPGIYPLKYKDDRIAKIIDRAGGITPLAYVKGATLVRSTLLSERQRLKREETFSNLNLNKKVKDAEAITDDTDATIKTTAGGEEAESFIHEDIGIELDRILKNPLDSTYDIILQDGDEIIIPKRLETVRIEGEVLYPTSVKYTPKKNFLDYISESGGYTKKSAKSSAYVRYPSGKVDRTRKFLFVRFHPKVEPGSEIMIPAKSETTVDQIGKFSTLVYSIGGTLTGIVTVIGIIKLNK